MADHRNAYGRGIGSRDQRVGVEGRHSACGTRACRPIVTRRRLSLFATSRRFGEPHPKHARRLAEEIDAKVTSAEEAVQRADVVVTATSARQPVLHRAWPKPGCHANGDFPPTHCFMWQNACGDL
ncbi:MAG: hypothetical protein GWN84_05640 [Gammaproteobacteria bacterium]|nr:hypothetical protein [Gammaproteobacteria bacterium]NIR82460.1 hypothetical protein [Gammaproteobacteria bacterium]NIR88456.1 hypothetical protein [Gammaproteobacteria bacterium]NIU03596.1 hypothetical protein [Gammaproteobacteria bacterium]NIV50948.1 hypothetical protein [Gammaproteobacteria bacterium]